MKVDESWYYYHKDVSGIKVLNHQETIELFKQLHIAKINLEKKSIKNGERKSVAADEKEIIKIRDKIAEGNLRLVIKIAGNFLMPHTCFKFLDLVQEGSAGLLRAIDRFDYKRGVYFSTYASWWVVANITSSLCGNANIIKIPFRIRKIFNKIEGVRKVLERENGGEVEKEIVLDTVISLCDISRKDLENFQKSAIKEPIFLDDSIEIENKEGGRDNFLKIEDAVRCDKSQIPENIIIDLNMKEKIRQVLAPLTPQEEEIIKRRFGIGFSREQTLQEVGDRFGLCRERIRQLEKLALEKLKKMSLVEELYYS